MMGQLSLLNMACAAKARVRTITLTRATREEMLHFSILGGLERNHGIFVTKVQPGSKAAEAGLKRGDQVRFCIHSHTDSVEVIVSHLQVHSEIVLFCLFGSMFKS